MDKLILCFFLSFNLYAETTPASGGNIANESATNQVLLDNAKLADQYKQQAPGYHEPLSTNPNIKASTKSGNGLNLSDQDKQLSENYVDQVGANKIIKEKCAGEEMQAACAGQETKHKFMGIDSTMVGLVAKAYGMFGAVGSSKWNVKDDKPADASQTSTPTKPVEGAKGTEAKTKEEEDWCKYVPTAGETLATFTQQQAQQAMTGTQTEGTAQRDALLKAAKSHEERAKTAKMQMYGWYGGAACYTGMATAGPVVADTKIYVKIGAAAFLGAFYQSEVSANEDAAKKVKAIADALPGKGDCNPITHKTCYCAQEEHKNDPQYCLPQGLHNNPVAAKSYRVACTDNTLKIDPGCNCIKTNSCLDNYIATQDAANSLGIGLGNGGALNEVRALSRGELVGGNLAGNVSANSKAIANKGLQEMSARLGPNNSPLSHSQKTTADALMANGIPANIARLMASQDVSKAAGDKAIAGYNNFDVGNSGGGKSRLVDFSGGHGLGISGKTATKKDDDLLAKLNPNKNNAANSRLLEFAAKAEEEARKKGQIMKSDKPLFEIISNRYQESGRRLLEIDPPKN